MLRLRLWWLMLAWTGCGGSVVSSWGEDKLPEGGVAPLCTPGVHRCSGTLLEVCRADGAGYEPVYPCPIECNAQGGSCGLCVPGSWRCLDDHTLAQCWDSGLGEQYLTCPPELAHCAMGQCVQCIEADLCPGSSKLCEVARCIDGQCAVEPAPAGAWCAPGKQCTAGAQCCVVNQVEARLWPLDIYFMLDRSGSMEGAKWERQAQALETFFALPSSGDVTVGMGFFPGWDLCIAEDAQCSGKSYQKPQVAWGKLPMHAQALQAAIAQTAPNGCITPTQDALAGLLEGARNRKLAMPDHVVVAAIVSDGGPCCQSCPVEDIDGLGQMAVAYANGSPSLATFAIYVSQSASAVMHSIAKGGGTGEAFDASTGTEAFVQALRAIQAESIPCQLQTGTTVLDPKTASLMYTPTEGGVPQPVARVEDPLNCDVAGGWYFDNPVAPKLIKLCPEFCDKLKQDPGARITTYLECDG